MKLKRAFLAAGTGVAAGLGWVAAKDLTSGDPIRARFPVVYWGRWAGQHLGPLLRQYIVAADEDERPFSRVERDWIRHTATRKTNTVGFGSQYDYEKIGSVAFTPKTFTNPTTLTEQVGTGYRRIIGGRGTPPVVMDKFMYISGMSYGALSERAITALNIGARGAGVWHNTGEGGLSDAHLHGGGLISQIGTAKYGIRNDDGSLNEELLAQVAEHDEVKMFELKLAQGAKPGKGGILPAAKITQAISEIRKVPMGQDAISPPRFSEFGDVAGLFDFLDRLRSITNKPTGLKMVIGNADEIVAIASAMAAEPGRGPDFITIDGGEGGSGAAPLVLASYSGLPVRQALTVTHRALINAGVRDDVTLFASGKLATPAEVGIALALGADAVGTARGAMLALGCIQSLRCHLNTCPTGIATQDESLERVLDVRSASERVERYFTELMAEVEMLARSCGHDDPTQLVPDDVLLQIGPGRYQPLGDVVPVKIANGSRSSEEAPAR